MGDDERTTASARHAATRSAAPGTTRMLAAAAGVASALFGVGVGELSAALIAPASGPLAVIGGALIDAAPSWAKDLAIALFGTADKVALLGGIGLVLIVLAALTGWAESRQRHIGSAVAALLGVGIGVIAMTRPQAGLLSWMPAVLAGTAAAVAVSLLVRRLAATRTATAATEELPTRRGFLLLIGATAAVGVLAAAGGSLLRAGSTAVATARDRIRLPRAATPAPAVPAAAELGVPGLAPVITPNPDFYRIDTALVVPTVSPADWELRVHGLVEEEVRLRWDELLELPLVETAVTLSCVSNEVGGDLIGNAIWLGYPIRELLARARPLPEADMVLSQSIDGFTASTPLEALTDDRQALLAIGMNGEPLPPEHGFPVRLVVPGLYGYVSATKWVTSLEVTRFDRKRAYWTDRGWSERGPIKLQSRIDVPRRTAVPAGDTVIAGMAWHPHTGVAAVEVQIDDGPWQQAELAAGISDDTWVQWRMPWHADAGSHRIRCRATSADGETQTDDVAPPAPDGATGWHTIQVTVSES